MTSDGTYLKAKIFAMCVDQERGAYMAFFDCEPDKPAYSWHSAEAAIGLLLLQDYSRPTAIESVNVVESACLTKVDTQV